MANGIKLRSWALYAEDYINEYGHDTGFREAVAAELAALEHMGERLGVGFVCAPARSQDVDGTYRTTAWIFQTETVPPTASWTPEPISLGEDNEGTAPVESPDLEALGAE